MEKLIGSNHQDLLSEVYFLVAKFLNDGPCKKTSQVFEQELSQRQLLPCKYDPTGKKIPQSLDELSKKYPHITSGSLVSICKRLRDVQESNLPAGIAGVTSILCDGRYSLLRTNNKPRHCPSSKIFGRLHGCPLQEFTLTNINIVRTLEARRVSGPISRKHVIWPKFYSRLQLLKQTLGHLSAVYCVLFDQTGHYFFTGADDLLVKVWSTHSSRLLATFRGASSEITDLAVNLENTLLAAGSLDHNVYVWCLQTTSLVARLVAPVGMITGVNFCPTICGDFRYLASTSSDGSVAFWVYTHQPIGKETVFLGNPVLFNEKMRPGVAQMICSAFSPGGIFLAAGSADHHVRVYFIPGDGGPQRIMEEEAHSDRVDSIQWANRNLRFVSGAKDASALVWRFHSQKWTNLRLDITAELPGTEITELQRQKPRVSMVSWDLTDQWIVTALHDASLKVWNSETGELLKVMRKHRKDVFVLEPHPLDAGITLSAAHDGLLCIWDILQGTCLYQYQNLLEVHGIGSFYDVKWSPDGTVIAATDSCGHILLFGFGAANQLLKTVPRDMFFNTDYWPVQWDENRGVVDETTGEDTHLMGAPFLVDIEGTPYPTNIQCLVPGREFDSAILEPKVPSNAAMRYRALNEPIPAYFRSAEEAAANRTPNGYVSNYMLSPLPPSTIQQIRDKTDAVGNEEKLEYEREMLRPPVPVKKLLVDQKLKPKKKRARKPQAYQTRAATEENDFLDPESLNLSYSSANATDSSSELSEDSEPDGTSGTEYSDWIAGHGVALEPPKRSRRRRPPRRLSPGDEQPTRRRNRENKDGERQKETVPEEQTPPSTPGSPKAEMRLEDVPKEFLPPKWLSEVVARKAPYYPQMGDEVMFFQEGYQLYLDAVRQKQVYKPSTRDSFSKLGLPDPILSKVIGIKYEIRPPRLCCLRLAVLAPNGEMTCDFFNIKCHDMPDVIDFLVLKQTYDIAMKRKWKAGDRFRCVIDDSWWLGTIASAAPDGNSTSPFLSLMTKWDNGEDEPMSPWDLEPLDPTRIPAEDGGSIGVLPEENLRLLYSPRPDEWPGGDRDGTCDRIIAGIEKVMTLAVAEAFLAPVDLNLYPLYAKTVEYPIDLSTIKARLENRFYRRLVAVQFDVRYLATNAEKFNDVHSQIVKHARIVTDLCLRIVKDQQEDVVAVYHQLADAYQSSSDEEAVMKDGQCESTDWRGDCERLLRELTAHSDSAPFREPVDLLEFPDYLQVVETPMDLGTVRGELMAGNYNTPREFYEAIRQIFTNSKTYNTNKRSRIFSMSIRLSNLFEARLKQLTAEWKASRKRRIRQSVQARKQRLERKFDAPSTSRQSNVNPGLMAVEPQPSTSRARSPILKLEPLRITIFRNRSSDLVYHAARNSSSSDDDDTNLSTLRRNFLKKSGSEDEQLRVGGRDCDDSNSSMFAGDKVITLPVSDDLHNNGNVLNEESTTSDGEVLATLKTNAKRPDEVNGHSYAKPALSLVLINETKANNVEGDADGSSQYDSSEDGNENESNSKEKPRQANGELSNAEFGTDEECSNGDSSSEWNDESEETDLELRMPTRSSQRRRSKPQTRGRLRMETNNGALKENILRRRHVKSRESSRHPSRLKSQRNREESSESESPPPARKRRRKTSSDSDAWRPSQPSRRNVRSDSDDSEPLINTNGEPKPPHGESMSERRVSCSNSSTNSNRRSDSNSDTTQVTRKSGRSSVRLSNKPQTRGRSKLKRNTMTTVVTTRGDAFRSKLKCPLENSESGDSTSTSSKNDSSYNDSDGLKATRRSMRKRQPRSDSDDEPLFRANVSSRGRIRTLTERARAALTQRD